MSRIVASSTQDLQPPVNVWLSAFQDTRGRIREETLPILIARETPNTLISTGRDRFILRLWRENSVDSEGYEEETEKASSPLADIVLIDRIFNGWTAVTLVGDISFTKWVTFRRV